MYCGKCGKQIDDGARFCPYCGAEQSQPQPVPWPAAQDDRPEEPSKPKKSRLPLIIALLAVTLAVVGGVVLCLQKGVTPLELIPGLGKKTAEEEPSPTPESSSTQLSATPTPSPTPTATPEPTATPLPELVQDVPSAQASDTQVVFRNARAGATVTCNGAPLAFTYVGKDIVVERSNLPDVCQVRIVAPTATGWETAAVWYNAEKKNNDLSFGDASFYGEYEACAEDGLNQPSEQLVNVLTWAYYRSFLQCINDQTLDEMEYSTVSNTQQQFDAVFKTNADVTYNIGDFTAICDPASITYQDGKLTYNGSFRCIYTGRKSGKTAEITNHRTLEIVWQDGYWKVNRIARLSDDDFAAGKYAELP